MTKLNHNELRPLAAQLCNVVRDLEKMFPARPFTHKADLGEVLATDAYALKLLRRQAMGVTRSFQTVDRSRSRQHRSNACCFDPALDALF